MPTGDGRPLPPAFWDLPAVSDALTRRDLGDIFNLVHAHFGWSQYEIANMTDLTQPRVNGYMNHKPKRGPTMDTIAKAADGLDMPTHARQKFGLARSLSARHSSAEGPKLRLSEIFNLVEYMGRTGDISGLDTWRDAAKAVGPGDAWARLTEVMSIDTPAELRGPERIKDQTRGFFLAAAKLPARLLTEALTAHVNLIGFLLDTAPGPEVRRELTMASGKASYLIACCDLDLGDLGSARNGLEVTGEAAREAGDAALAAITLDGHSYLHALTGDRRKALAVVQQGLERAATSGSPGTLAHMQLREAEAHVNLGHAVRGAKAWEEAEASYASTDLLTDRDWTRLWLTPDSFASVRAFIYASTDRCGDAIPVAQGVASRLSGALGKVDAAALGRVALALALAGEFSAAARAGQQALEAIRAAEVRSSMPRAHLVAQMIRDHGKLTSAHKAFIYDVEATQRQLDALQPKRAG